MMPCTKIDCNQGRNCDCGKSNDKAVVFVVLFFVLMIGLVYVVFELVSNDQGLPCAVTLQFKDSKATYIGASL